jgi:hypothetical protein
MMTTGRNYELKQSSVVHQALQICRAIAASIGVGSSLDCMIKADHTNKDAVIDNVSMLLMPCERGVLIVML